MTDSEQDIQRAVEELRCVEGAIAALTGLASNWNGSVSLHVKPPWRGTKPFGCAILLDAERQMQDVRWRTLIHEMLHAYSEGYNRSAFDDFPGWEEGVVEKLQRLLRPQILDRLGLTISETVFADEESEHGFNPYIEALETLFLLVQRPGESEIDFYLALLSTPIRQRMIWMFGRGKQLPADKGRAFLLTFAAASATLRRRIKA